MLTVVDGLLRTAMHRDPNGVECDTCGKRVNFDRAGYKAELTALAASGWTIPKGYDDPAYCPEHHPEIS